MTAARKLDRKRMIMLAGISASSVANGYYIHPMVAEVARDLHVSTATVGIAPAANQIALAIGVLFLLPLGDIVSNRRLCMAFLSLQCLALAAMAMAPSFHAFTAASTLLGFVTVTPYLLPAYASKRVDRAHLSRATSYLAAGAIVGIFTARISAGIITEYFGWRFVYWGGTVIMLTTVAVVFLVMDHRDIQKSEGANYVPLIISSVQLFFTRKTAFLAGLLQACNFGMLVAIWLGLALYLTGPEMGYGADAVSYMTAISLSSVFATPRIAAWAERVGARRALIRLGCLKLVAVSLLWFAGGALMLLVPALLLLSFTFGPTDVVNRVTILSMEAGLRTRLMANYVVMTFTGAGLASWFTTKVYANYGWHGVLIFAAFLAIATLILSWIQVRAHTAV